MTPTVTPIEISITPRQEFNVTTVTGYLIKNVLTPKEFQSLNAYWERTHVHGVDYDRSTYLYKGKTYATANQRNFGETYDRKIFDLAENPDWYYQTPETMCAWAWEQAALSIHPVVMQIFEKMKTLPPLNEEPDKWVLMRGIINVLMYNHHLANHFDGDPSLFHSTMDQSREYSITIYLNEVSLGGEFWVYGEPGFIYKPVANSAFIFSGGSALHGVNANMDAEQKTRRAITFRVGHVDSLHLPGSPDQFLFYQPPINQLNKDNNYENV